MRSRPLRADRNLKTNKRFFSHLVLCALRKRDVHTDLAHLSQLTNNGLALLELNTRGSLLVVIRSVTARHKGITRIVFYVTGGLSLLQLLKISESSVH